MALIVSEVMYHPTDDDEALEFIELYNDRAVSEVLTGYAFSNGIEFVFEDETVIGPRQYLVIARDPNALKAVYDVNNVLGPFAGRLSNGGERVELNSDANQVVISFSYRDDTPWPVAADGTGHSLILTRPGRDPEEASSWAASTYIGGTPGGPDLVQEEPEDPTLVPLIQQGDPGRYFKGTKEPSPSAGQPGTGWTQINFNDDPASTDWLAGPTGYGYSNSDNELQFIETQLDDMSGSYVSIYARIPFELTTELIDMFSQLRAEVHYDDAFVLYLNGTRVADSGNIAGNPPAYNQTSEGASDPPAANIDLTGSLNLLVPGTNVLAIQAHNATLSGSSDAMASPVLNAVIEDQSTTAEDPTARVLINELLANSDAAPGVDWIELYNPGATAVDLSNVYLSDDRDELLQYKIPDGTVLQPGEFRAFREGVPPDGFEFALNFAGQTVYVTAATDDPSPIPLRVMDAVRYDAMPPDTTFGRYPDGSGRFDLLSSPTFAAFNARPIIGDIVINEIMYHHGTRDQRYEYIELYNRGASTVSLAGWALTDGVEYEFGGAVQLAPGEYLVVAEDPNFLAGVYDNLTFGANLLGPYSGGLDDHSERIELSYPIQQEDPDSGEIETEMVMADQVTYYDGGRWPIWADGQGGSLELRDPHSNNNTPGAWDASDESAKSQWRQFEFTISGGDTNYTHDNINVFSLLLLNRGEVLIDDVELIVNGSDRLANNGFEAGQSPWRFLGNHVSSFVTTEDRHSGSRSLHLMASGHGDPGANRINQSINTIYAGNVTFRGWARWLKGSRYLLLRTTRERAPVQPPRPAHAFELDMPLNQGTPGAQNTAFVANRGPDVLDVRHEPVIPAAGEPIVVTARITDPDGITNAILHYRTEGQTGFSGTPMVDDGTGADRIAGDSIYAGIIPGASAGSMRAFYINAYDATASTRFPTLLPPSSEVPERTCLVRVGDSMLTTRFATYRIWLSDAVLATFQSRPNLSNELLDCTFVYNEKEVFYNTRIRFRGSPFIRSGANRDPRSRYAYRLDFPPDRKFQGREEINLDNTEGGNRGPLQERASYWFYRQMGLQHSRQEYVRLIINGRSNYIYEDVQKIDGDYVDAWFGDDNDGYIHKIDDYFEYTADGTGFSNLDEGLKSDQSHPPLAETYRWGFEKRSHRENDQWSHLIDFAVAMNTPSNDPAYEDAIESVIDPEHFARVLAIRHAVGDWDSYGYNRGKNNYFYYALPEGKWYLLPWDIDFTLGSGNGPNTDLFSVAGGKFPEVAQFLNYGKYRRMYLQAFAELVNGPWQTSYGRGGEPTEFDRFLDEAAEALIADGLGDGRRDGIKQFVIARRGYILEQIPSLVFEITSNGGQEFCTSDATVTIEGAAPLQVSAISVNGAPLPAEFSGNNAFQVEVPIEMGANELALQGLDGLGNPVPDATDSIVVTRVPPTVVTAVTPNPVCQGGVANVAIHGSGFVPGSDTQVELTSASEEVGFDALYVQSSQAFDQIDAATLLLDDPTRGVGDETRAVHKWINLFNTGSQGEFAANETTFAPPYNGDGTNYAVRFTGYVYAPSPGKRYFGVNSDDGFSLWIDGQLVGEYASPRGPATTNVVQNRTAGTMTFDFPAAGTYFLQLDYYENAGGEEIEFFQTNATGGDMRLINVDSELVVFRDDVLRIEAADVVVAAEDRITCQIDLSSAEIGNWNVNVTPECGAAAEGMLEGGLTIVACTADFNGDAEVNFQDWAGLADNWDEFCGTPDWCDGADLDRNGVVDMQDVAEFAGQWLLSGL